MINKDFLSFAKVCNAIYDEYMTTPTHPTTELHKRAFGEFCPNGGCVGAQCSMCPFFFSAGHDYIECDCPNRDTDDLCDDAD